MIHDFDSLPRPIEACQSLLFITVTFFNHNIDMSEKLFNYTAISSFHPRECPFVPSVLTLTPFLYLHFYRIYSICLLLTFVLIKKNTLGLYCLKLFLIRVTVRGYPRPRTFQLKTIFRTDQPPHWWPICYHLLHQYPSLSHPSH